jgi:hypothetical protein
MSAQLPAKRNARMKPVTVSAITVFDPSGRTNGSRRGH